MTKPPRTPELRSVSLRLHVSTRTVTWAVIYRTQKGDAVFDRRVSSGVLEHPAPLVGPEGVVQALRQAVEDIESRYGLTAANAAREPLGAVGGGPGRSHTGLPHLLHAVQDPDET